MSFLRHPRLVLLFVAAVIWAPGWYGEGPAQHQREADLAARVLAPTVNEGEIRKLSSQQKQQLSGRQAKRWPPIIMIKAVATLGLGTVALVRFWVVGFHSEPVLGRYSLLSHFSRAPPASSPGR